VVKLGGRPYFTLAEKADGTIWAWGMNQFGQMGNGTLTPFSAPPNSVPVLVSNSQPGGPINAAAQITCGYQFGAALTTNGTVWVWGSGTHGEQGTGATTTNYIPVQVPRLTNITQISAGWFHILARKADGTAWAWGDNSHGELGDGTTNNAFSPVRVLNVSNIVAVSGGDSHSSALAADGTIWKFGKNDVGELGNGSANTNANPFPAKILTDKFANAFGNVVIMAARDYHNIALKADGSVWMWGANDQGQCGVGTTNRAWQPSPVVGLGPRVGLPLNLTASQPGLVNLSWSSSTGQYFNLEYSTNLANGFGTTLLTNIMATPPTNVVAVPAAEQSGFFRLRF
jgi:alpha-tubulin suppressor-like RCC1 family protein